MRVVVSEKSPMERTVEIQIDAAEVRKSYDRQLAEASRQVAIPGFRKGKAPRHVVERRANMELMRRGVFEDLGLPAYEKAVKQENLVPLGQPGLDFVQFDMDKDLIFRATFEVRPEITMEASDYEGLEVALEKSEVADEDVAHVLEDFRRKGERIVTVDDERGLERGDVAVVDFTSSVGAEVLPNGTAVDFQLDVDDTMFVPGFSDNLVGMKAGEERTFDFEFPESYQNQSLAGKNVTFEVKLKTIKKRVLPELNDDLAAEVSGFATMDELRGNVRERLERKIRSEIGTRALDRLAVTKDIPTPQAFVQQTVQMLAENQARQLASMGIGFEDFLKQTGMTVEQLVQQLRPQALRMARSEQVRDAIVRAEAFEVSSEELDAEVHGFAAATNQELDVVLRSLEQKGGMEAFRRDLLRQKVHDFLASRCTVVKPEPAPVPAGVEPVSVEEQEAPAVEAVSEAAAQ